MNYNYAAVESNLDEFVYSRLLSTLCGVLCVHPVKDVRLKLAQTRSVMKHNCNLNI